MAVLMIMLFNESSMLHKKPCRLSDTAVLFLWADNAEKPKLTADSTYKCLNN